MYCNFHTMVKDLYSIDPSSSFKYSVRNLFIPINKYAIKRVTSHVVISIVCQVSSNHCFCEKVKFSKKK